MNKIFLLVLVVLASQITLAQMPGMGAGAARGGRGQANIGHFYGKVVDAKTNKGMDAASVQLVMTRGGKDSIIAGMLTQGNGDFSLENLPLFGQFRLKITAIGYTAIDQKVAFDLKAAAGAAGGQGGQGDMSQALNAIDKDLGNIKLQQNANELESVTVTASKPLIQMGIDRKIFNVEKNINSAGGTAVDIMRTIPSVNVDIDGNVTMRNAAPQIFVDGRPTTLTLDQIPSDAIQSVELITNPSAKYDASGGQAGILNVVLKKNRKAGYNGSIRAGIDSRAKINAGGDINVRQGKVNVFGNINYNQRKSKSWGETDRTTTLNGTETQMNQNNNNLNTGEFLFGRLGIDYFIDNRNTITLSQNIVDGSFNSNNRSNALIDTLAPSGFEAQYRNTLGSSNFRNYGTQLSFKHTFAEPNKEWTADVNYNKSTNTNESNIYSRSFFDAGLQNPKFPEALQNVKSGGDNHFLVVQTDYVDPINETMKWEAGLRMQTRTSSSSQLNTYNGIEAPDLSSNFKYTDYVYAGYATFSQKIKDKFSYQFGLRAESSNYHGEQIGKQKYKNSFPLSLFPSVFLTKSFENRQDLQLNYSRRVNRPNFFQLMPNTDYSDTLNYQTGNPNLKPEFTNSLELSYQKTYGAKSNQTFLATLFGKYTTDLIARYQSRQELGTSGDSAFVSTWVNASTAYAGGLELVFRNTITTWWESTISGNVYYSKINGSTMAGLENLENERTSWTAKMNHSFKFGKGFSAQLSGEYQSRSALPVSTSNSSNGGGRGGGGGFMGGGGSQSTTQGYIDANYGVDLGLRKDFQIKSNTLTVSANWSDIFRTRRYRAHSIAEGFIQDVWTRRDPQIVRVNISYRFGKFDMSLFKRKNAKGDAEGMQNGMQGIQQ